MTRAAKSGVKALLARLGYTIERIGGATSTTRQRSMSDAIAAIVARGHPLGTVVDIGASNGVWSSLVMPSYPYAAYLLIEAQPVHEQSLVEFCRNHPNSQFVLAAAGERRGEINFLADKPLGGAASYSPFSKDNIIVPVTTVDEEVEERGLPGPYLIKLDTHGFEVPILSGSHVTLRTTEIVVVETYNFKISPECLLFFEMCHHLGRLGFHCIDMVEPLFRPHDGALWQVDLVFARGDRPEFSYLGYE